MQKVNIRLDDWEMEDKVQNEITKLWDLVTTENIGELGDIEGYWEDFYTCLVSIMTMWL